MKKTVLVNKNHKVKENYLKKITFVTTTNYLGEEIKVEKETYGAFLELQQFLLSKKIEIEIEEGYRTIEEQQRIQKEFSSKYGEEYAKKIVAPPFTSEHHTGLAIDLVLKKEGEYIIENEELLAQEEIWNVIHSSLKDYGFIVRYPKEKENITGYFYEPWHIRYVGVVPATIMYQHQLTLEEYLEHFGGVLVVDKKPGMTSRDVVNEIGNVLGLKKVGHTGTLDPMASGVLVVTIGKATKIGELLTSYEKEYEAEVSIGFLTDTLDTSGKIIKKKPLNKKIDYSKLLKLFEKTYLQEVPIYSAVKVKGKKLYEYARKGESIELPKKEVTIKKMTLLREESNCFQFKCLVSKGTYIRSLIRDMGDFCQEYFTMSKLKRTKQGNFSLEGAYSLEDIKKNHFQIVTIEDALSSIPIVILEGDKLKKVSNGVILPCDIKIKDQGKVIFKDKDNKLLVIYKRENKSLKIDKMIYNYFN